MSYRRTQAQVDEELRRQEAQERRTVAARIEAAHRRPDGQLSAVDFEGLSHSVYMAFGQSVGRYFDRHGQLPFLDDPTLPYPMRYLSAGRFSDARTLVAVILGAAICVVVSLQIGHDRLATPWPVLYLLLGVASFFAARWALPRVVRLVASPSDLEARERSVAEHLEIKRSIELEAEAAAEERLRQQGKWPIEGAAGD